MSNKLFKKFGVYFGDNDFSNTYLNLLPVIARSIYYRQEDYERRGIKIDKELISSLINKCVTGFYYAFQNPLAYNESSGYPDVYDYLHIDSSKVYIDDELDELIKKNNGWCNSELFCVVVFQDHNKELFAEAWSV